MRPQRWQPTRLPRPWDSLGKNTGGGFHFLLQCMKVKSESEVALLCPTLSNLMDCSPPGSSIHEFSRKSTGMRCHRLLSVFPYSVLLFVDKFSIDLILHLGHAYSLHSFFFFFESGKFLFYCVHTEYCFFVMVACLS